MIALPEFSSFTVLPQPGVPAVIPIENSTWPALPIAVTPTSHQESSTTAMPMPIG